MLTKDKYELTCPWCNEQFYIHKEDIHRFDEEERVRCSSCKALLMVDIEWKLVDVWVSSAMCSHNSEPHEWGEWVGYGRRQRYCKRCHTFELEGK